MTPDSKSDNMAVKAAKWTDNDEKIVSQTLSLLNCLN